jgi:catechol 2,3-dioxygenase-like lactoylglutathione lyase family enzyme
MVLPELSLNHLNLPARDPDALRRWYAEKLGFREHGRFLWSGASLLVFVEGTPIATDAIHFGFRVESLAAMRAWIDCLRMRGVEVGEPEGDETYSTVYVLDPEGNRFELFYETVPGVRKTGAPVR